MPCMLGSRHSGHCKEERGMRMSPEPGARCLGTYLSPTRPRWPKLCRKQKWASDPAMEWGGGGGVPGHGPECSLRPLENSAVGELPTHPKKVPESQPIPESMN